MLLKVTLPQATRRIKKRRVRLEKRASHKVMGYPRRRINPTTTRLKSPKRKSPKESVSIVKWMGIGRGIAPNILRS